MLKKWKNKLPLQKLIEELLKRKLPVRWPAVHYHPVMLVHPV